MEEPTQCPRCSKRDIKVDYDKEMKPRYSCKSCYYTFIPGTEF